MKQQKDFLYQMNTGWHYTQFYTTSDKLVKRQTFFNPSQSVHPSISSVYSLSGFNSTTSWKLLKLYKIK